MGWLSRLRNAVRSDRLDSDLNDEIEQHIEARTAELISQGMPPQEAERTARRRFGNRLAIREESREAKLAGWLESFLQDACFGARILRKEPGVTAAAVISLGLAIGACTAAFSLIDALALRPLPVPAPSKLVMFAHPRQRVVPGAPTEDDHFSYATFQAFQQAASDQASLFAMTVWGGKEAVTIDKGSIEKLRAQWISGDGLSTIGVRPFMGRLLEAKDDQPDAAQSVAVIGYNLWVRRFGADPKVLGRRLHIQNTDFQIVGVAQKNYSGFEPGSLTDLWLPIATYAPSRMLLQPGNTYFGIGGRLLGGAAPEQVRQILEAVLIRQPHDAAVRPALHVHSAAQGHASLVRWQFERPLWILGAVACLVLLIACTNVANLLVGRAAARRREMAMRSALGASRLRLIRQVLVEGTLLSVAACALGLLLAAWSAPMLVEMLGTTAEATFLDVRPDWRVIGFLAVAGMATTSLFGIMPAWRSSAAKSTEVLNAASGRQSARIGVLRPILAAQVGFSFVVLFLSGLLLISFQKLMSVNLGFSQRNVLVVSIDTRNSGPSRPGARGGSARARQLQFALLDRLRRRPGVVAAASSDIALIEGVSGWVMRPPIRFAGHDADSIRPQFLAVSPGFFATMQVPLRGGREFTPQDAEAVPVTAVVVNESFARHFFPGESAIGKRFDRMIDDNGNYGPQEIIGVVGDIKYNNLREETGPAVYQPTAGVGSVEIRTAGNPQALAGTLRLEIEEVDPSLTVTGVTMQSTLIDQSVAEERLLALVAGFFAFVAVVLAAVGLNGVLSYSVVRRTQEIGIRMALGAPVSTVIRLVMGDIGLTVGLGIAAGLAGGFALARLVTATLFVVKPGDFGTVALPLVCLLAASAAAALRPAMRAVGTDPVVALRHE